MRILELARRVVLALGLTGLASIFVRSQSNSSQAIQDTHDHWQRVNFSEEDFDGSEAVGEVALIFGYGLTGRAIEQSLIRSGFRVKLATRSNASDWSAEEIKQANVDLVVIATPRRTHTRFARQALTAGVTVITLSDDLEECQDLKELSELAENNDTSLIIGAGLSPGLSCLLAVKAANQLDECSDVVISKAGTAGPACARSHHSSLKGKTLNWVDGAWQHGQSGTGRLLHWFPEPIGGRDCYRAALASPLLLRPFLEVPKIRARLAANRRDRLTSRLPMLRPPHTDGGPAGIRVEANGESDGASSTVVYGVSGSPSYISAEVVAAVAELQLSHELPRGAYGLAGLRSTDEVLAAVAGAGIRVFRY